MSKKLTIEFVNNEFTKEGYKLLSSKYVNAKTKLEYLCPEGHHHFISWNNWKTGYRCAICSNNKKLTLHDVECGLAKEGYTLLSSEYLNAKTKFKYSCPNNHVNYIDWDHWNRGRRCPDCSGNKKLKLIIIKKCFEVEGYILLSDNYLNSNSYLEYICPAGHTNRIKWNHWQMGKRCPNCWALRRFGSGNPSWRGGVSLKPYCSVWKDKQYKEDIKQRDGYKCLNPYCDSNESNDLTIHHIDYNKKNCGPLNLITICRSCNSRANKDRKWHKAWYQAIIKNRYLGGI